MSAERRAARDKYHGELSSSLNEMHAARPPMLDRSQIDLAVDASQHVGSISCRSSTPLYVKWHSTVPGPVLGNGLLVDLTGDGQLDLAVATSATFVELLHTATPRDAAEAGYDADEASDERTSTAASVRGGSRATGWPAVLPGAEFGVAPHARDINDDGVPELAVATQSGEIIYLTHDGKFFEIFEFFEFF